MKSKAQKDRERMQELGGCIAEGLKQGWDLPLCINQTANISIKIPLDISPKEPYEFVGRINGSPLTQCRKQNLRSH